MFKHKAAIIIATKDRPEEIRRTLRSIENGTVLPDEIIIVDSGSNNIKSLIIEFSCMNIRYLRCCPPSATRQRNMGIQNVSDGIKLVGFFDDDIVLQQEAFERMMDFWENAEDKIGGTAFNMINHPKMAASILKKLRFTESLGLYSSHPGSVMQSGFHTMIGHVDLTTFVQWLPTGASLFRRRVLREYRFDEWFKGYSYLEDLDFSYRIGKKYALAVVADAGYSHYPGSAGRGGDIEFGRREVLNRVYFVRKNKELSLNLCFAGLFIRIAMSIVSAVKDFKRYYLLRVWGNILGLMTLLLLGSSKDRK